jgi:serine/threonine protein kinase
VSSDGEILYAEFFMSATDFKRVEELFHQALALPAAERSALLAAACAGDAALLAAVEELLQHDNDSDTFLVSPVAGAAQQHRELPPTLLDLHRAATLPPPPPFPELPGYELLQELGRGGMGVVYKARQTNLNRLVAVKMLLPVIPITAEQLARFRIEAQVLARLNHPNIVAIYDICEPAGLPYFVMEYVPGPSLAQVLRGQPQDPLASAHLIEAVARAIAAVHACGIIHRDLKPANILLEGARGDGSGAREGMAATSFLGPRPSPLAPPRVKITDFGLAKAPADRRKLTQTGATVGTPCYMAPEQATHTGVAISPAADIYALGSILYEMLVGRPPFDADSPLATLLCLVRDEPVSPATLRPRLPRDLVTICLKCLEKSPGRRYANAGALADDLHRFQHGEPIRARPVSTAEHAYRWCRRRPLVAGLLALVGTLVLTFVVTILDYNARLQAALNQLEAQSEQQHRQIVQLHIHIGIGLLESGDSFAALLRFAEALRLDENAPQEAEHRRRIATTLDRCPQLTELLNLEAPVLAAAVTATGGFVATVSRDNGVAVWHVPSRRQMVAGLAHPELPVRGALSADGQVLGTITASGTVRIWDLTTGNARILPVGQGPAVVGLAFHANGRLLLTEHTDASVRSWSLATVEPTLIEQVVKRPSVLAVSRPDARWLFTVDAANRGQLWDVDTGKPACQALEIANPVLHAAVSADGHRVAVMDNAGIQRVWDAETGRPIGKSLPTSTGDGSMTLSPAGRHLFTWDGGGAGKLWDVDKAQMCTPLLRQGGPLLGAAIDAAGERLVTVGKNGVVCFWDLAKSPSAASRPIGELLAMVQVHAGGRLDELHAFQPLSISERRAVWETLHLPR